MARQKRKAPDTYQEFLFWVRLPSTYYNFSLQHDRRISNPYDEHHTLHFDVECIYPDRCKGREAQASFHPDRRMAEGSEFRRTCKERPLAVGSIIVGKARFDVGGFLPPDVLWPLAPAMAAGTITSMSANGRWPTKGHGYLNSVSFHGPEFDPIAYLG